MLGWFRVSSGLKLCRALLDSKFGQVIHRNEINSGVQVTCSNERTQF